MKKIIKWFDGRKTYLGAGLLIVSGFAFAYLLITYGYDNGIAWKLVETMVTIGLGIFGVGARHALAKQEKRLDDVKTMVDRRKAPREEQKDDHA